MQWDPHGHKLGQYYNNRKRIEWFASGNTRQLITRETYRQNTTFGKTFMMLKNKKLAFHFLDKEMTRRLISLMIKPKLKYVEIIWSTHKKNTCDEIGKNTENSN